MEQKIHETEERLGSLRGENSELIRALCKIREENIDFRDALNIAKGAQHAASGYGSIDSDKSTFARDDTPASSAASFDSVSSEDPLDSSSFGLSSDLAEEYGSLQELLSTIWKLIRSHPGVSHGTVSAKAVLDQLISQVESR